MARRGSKRSPGSGSGRSGQGGARRSEAGGRKEGPRGRSGGARPKGGSGRSGAGEAQRRRPKGLGGDQVEGRHAVRELLLAGKRRVREVLIMEDLAPAEILIDIQELAREMAVPCRTVSKRHFGTEALTDSHQGVLAKAAPLPEADFDRLAADSKAFLLVLDGVTDPGNLGSILRTAECAGVTGVVIGRHRSARVSPTVTKTAAGAVEHVPLVAVGGIPSALSDLSKAGVFTVGLDEAGTSSVFDLPGVDRPVALVLGAEGAGLSRLVRERVDLLASIPLSGQLNSLNVATAAAVACFEVLRQRSAN